MFCIDLALSLDLVLLSIVTTDCNSDFMHWAPLYIWSVNSEEKSETKITEIGHGGERIFLWTYQSSPNQLCLRYQLIYIFLHFSEFSLMSQK